jgi:hypothetical protein
MKSDSHREESDLTQPICEHPDGQPRISATATGCRIITRTHQSSVGSTAMKRRCRSSITRPSRMIRRRPRGSIGRGSSGISGGGETGHLDNS